MCRSRTILLTALIVSSAHGAEATELSARERYRLALTHLSKGEAQEAVNEVIRLESDPGAGGEDRNRQTRRRARTSTGPAYKYLGPLVRPYPMTRLFLHEALGLAAKSPEVAIPLAALHSEVWKWDIRHDRLSLADQAAHLVFGLLDLYFEQDGDRSIAAAIVLGMAFEARGHGYFAQSSALIASALRLDPGNALALHSLAVQSEKEGRYREAVDRLREALLQDPSHGPARLRLAICLARTARQASAQEHLQELLSSNAASWVRVVASQELARLLADANDKSAAINLLTESLASHPKDQGLRTLLHLYLENHGRAADSPLEPAADLESQSARYLYDLWPQEDVQTVAREVPEAVDARLPQLSLALEAYP